MNSPVAATCLGILFIAESLSCSATPEPTRPERHVGDKEQMSFVSDIASKRLWDEKFLASLISAREGDAINLELVGGNIASGTVAHLDLVPGEVTYVSGVLGTPEQGRSFVQT